MKKTKRKKIVIHSTILLCVALLLSTIMLFTSKKDITIYVVSEYFLQSTSSIFLLLAPPIYLNIYWLIPGFLMRKRYVSYAGIALGLILVWGFVIGVGEPWMDRHLFNKTNEEPSIEGGIVGMIFILILTTLIHISYRWFLQLSKIKQIENDQLHLELASLKNQINPHFFFNTLNNLYALSLEKSDNTPSVILKLSEMMRYTIYDCKEPKVSISGEVTYINNYIELQKVRHHKRGIITFKNEIIDTSIKIAPMLLIVFIENAFKHGFDTFDKNAFINIHLKINGNQLQFKIENNYHKNELDIKHGIGLENVKRRLSLLYPNAHHLIIVKNNNIFSVQLKLDLL